MFAAGDAVYGTKSVIAAIESGRRAAQSIDRYLGGDGDISEILAPVEEPEAYIGKEEGFACRKRAENTITPLEERKDSFTLVDHGICGDGVCGEAGRCLQCDLRLNITQPRLWGDYESEGGRE